MTALRRALRKEEVSASFFRGGLEFRVEQQVDDLRYGLMTITSSWPVRANRRAIERALRKLGFVREAK